MDESRIADPSSALRRSDRSLPTRLSRAVSVVLHPLVMPLYVILLLVAGPTQLSYFPASVKFYLLWVTVLYTAVIPLLSVGLLRSVGRISSLAIDDRRERILPLAIGIVCYLLCAATVARIPSAMIVRKFMLAGACCELFCLAPDGRACPDRRTWGTSHTPWCRGRPDTRSRPRPGRSRRGGTSTQA